MADYKGIKGGKVQNFSTNPPAPITGQVWYNETTRTLNYHAAAAGSWAAGGPSPRPSARSRRAWQLHGTSRQWGVRCTRSAQRSRR